MMPAVAVPPRPNGLPMVITQSPTRGLAWFSKFTYGNAAPLALGSTTFRTARSVPSSRPTMVAFSSRPSLRTTLMPSSSASATTWLLVTR
jgi:hypothetical protein